LCSFRHFPQTAFFMPPFLVAALPRWAFQPHALLGQGHFPGIAWPDSSIFGHRHARPNALIIAC
ncbi:MAG: hypothetical protein H7836_07125, partial [Magnetococcus sp. YQC-3]